MWHTVTDVKSSENGAISATAIIPVHSEWFSGHFPNDPILPGIAQIGFVYDMLKQVFDGKVDIQNLSRIRFKKIIRPGDQLEIRASVIDTKKESFSFSIMVNTDVVCSGSMTVKSD